MTDGRAYIPGYTGFQLLGRGGFSSVYRARQETYDRSVAVKIIDIGIDDEATRRRFNRECAATGRLTGHPNILTILDSGFLADGRPYLTTALCSGGSLGERLEREGPLPVPDVLRIGVKIAGALRTAHSNGIVHRDIKPENILLTGFGEPALADFGISIVESQTSVTKRTQAYTPNHAPPEVLSGALADESSDIYNFGSTLYQLLTGHPAFQHIGGNTGLALFVHRVLNEPPPAVARADVPESLQWVLRTAMAKRPAERFSNAEVMGHALHEVQSELGLRVDEMVVARPAAAPPAPDEQRTSVTPPPPSRAHTPVPVPAPVATPAAHLTAPPVSAAPEWTPPKRGGTRVGVIIGVVAAAVLLLGGGVTALILALGGGEDSGADSGAASDRGTARAAGGYLGPSECGKLKAEEALQPQGRVRSCEGGFLLTLQGDGNLVLSQNDEQVLWHSETTGEGGTMALMSPDGDFVVVDDEEEVIWSSGTAGNHDAWLAVQNDGNLVLYDAEGDVLWTPQTCVGCG